MHSGLLYYTLGDAGRVDLELIQSERIRGKILQLTTPGFMIYVDVEIQIPFYGAHRNSCNGSYRNQLGAKELLFEAKNES